MDKNYMIKHGAFNNLFVINNDVFIKYFGKNRNGQELKKFSTLVNRINTVSEKLIRDYWELYPDDPEKPGSGLLRLKGAIFEIFIDGFFKVMGATPSIGVYNYRPESAANDYGVDGFGLGADSKSLTVQVKFRSDATQELQERDIKQFPFQSYVSYGVDMNTNTNLLLVTSCKGLHPITSSQVFCSKIRVINSEHIKDLIDDNDAFWKNFNQIIDNTIKIIYGPKKAKEVRGLLSDIEDHEVEGIEAYSNEREVFEEN
jgi:hypothetical protein